MNPVIKLVFAWYLFLTALALSASISVSLGQLFSGLLVTWVLYLSFYLGGKVKCFYDFSVDPKILYKKRIPVIYLIGLSVISSVYATKFYTGNDLSGMLNILIQGGSLYNEYQLYFAENEIASFSMAKLPAILSLLVLKFTVMYSFICYYMLRKSVGLFNWVALVIITLADIFFSVARGTSFEIFELLMLIWFCMAIKSSVFSERPAAIRLKYFVLIAFALAAAFLYSYNIASRYSFGEIATCATREYCMSKETYLFSLSPAFAHLSFMFSGYFTFGIFYLTQFVNFWVSNPESFQNLLLPFSDINTPEFSKEFFCTNIIDCGVAWVPDAVNYIILFGVIILFFMVGLVGFVSNVLYRKVRRSFDFLYIVAFYYIFLALIALPVGNFITNSSSNLLMLILSICWVIYRLILPEKT